MTDIPDYLKIEIEKIDNKIDDTKTLLLDPQLKQIAEEEIKKLDEEKKLLLSPPSEKTSASTSVSPDNPFANRNIILEIRPGVGGNEAKIWANDLLRMYSRFAQNKKWQVELLNDGVIKIAGRQVYDQLKSEAGTHRVQRIPTTEKSGRIHTSTATIALLPELKDIDLYIDPKDVEFEAYRASSHGGQNVQKVSTAVRLRHKPTGLIVTCQTQRFQAQNREIAMAMLRAKLWEIEEEKRLGVLTDERRKQIGRGMRNEKIRTYNFPQDRVTDHRINKSWHHIETIMDGNLDEVINSF